MGTLTHIFPDHIGDIAEMDHSQDDRIIRELGAKLKKIRLEKDLSLRQLAALVDMDHTNIEDIEKGKTNTLITTVFALARALQIDPRDLLPPPGKG